MLRNKYIQVHRSKFTYIFLTILHYKHKLLLKLENYTLNYLNNLKNIRTSTFNKCLCKIIKKIPETEKLVLLDLGRSSLQQDSGNYSHKSDAEHANEGLVGKHVVDRLQCHQYAPSLHTNKIVRHQSKQH